MNMSAALTAYLYAKELSPSAERWYRCHLEQFCGWCESHEALELEDLTSELVLRFLKERRTSPSERYTGRSLSSHTVHGHARAIRAFLFWCGKRRWLDARTLWDGIDMPKREQKLVPTLTAEQVKALYRVAQDNPWFPHLAARDTAIVSVLLDTGIRASELCGLSLDRTYLRPDGAYLTVTGKGRKEREVGLGKKARLDLLTYIERSRKRVAPEGERHVFLTDDGHHPLTPEGLDRLLYRLRDKAGLKGVRVSAHVFRHTYATTYMRRDGADVLRLSRLLGHTSLAVTEEYLKSFSSRDARKGSSVLDELTRH